MSRCRLYAPLATGAGDLSLVTLLLLRSRLTPHFSPLSTHSSPPTPHCPPPPGDAGIGLNTVFADTQLYAPTLSNTTTFYAGPCQVPQASVSGAYVWLNTTQSCQHTYSTSDNNFCPATQLRVCGCVGARIREDGPLTSASGLGDSTQSNAPIPRPTTTSAQLPR